MKAQRIVIAGIAALVLVGLLVGFAFAAGDRTPIRSGSSSAAATCQTTHNSVAMQRMHAQMPAAAQTQCTQVHAQMGSMMSGLMGAGMMSSTGMMES